MNTWSRNKMALVISAALILLLVLIITVPQSKLPFIGSKQQQYLNADLSGAIAPQAKPIEKRDLIPIDINIPEGAGHLVEGYTADTDNKKVIIHIQDIHTNYEAQKNLSKIIETLILQNGLKLVMVEGGWGNVSLSYLRTYADKERRLEVAEEYLKTGKISGEEYLDIVSDYDIQLEGIETEDLYKQNLDAFFAIEVFRQTGATELTSIKHAVEQLKKKVYPPQVLELEQKKQGYQEAKISLADYYKYIDEMANKTRQEMSAFPNFSEFMKVTESEKQISFPDVEKERSRLIEKLSKTLPKKELTELVTKSLEFRLNKLTPAEYHSFLISKTEAGGEKLDNYPNLKKYIVYISSHENINTNRLFEEAETLQEQIKDRLIADAKQKRLNEISTGIRILDNFLHLKLIPADFSYYKQHKNDFITANWIDFLSQELGRSNIAVSGLRPASTVDKNLGSLADFYNIANERDDAFVKNAIRLMNESNQDIAVLIAGGFHTPTLTQKLRECGISYVVVAPHTTQETDPEQYRYILKYKSGREE